MPLQAASHSAALDFALQEPKQSAVQRTLQLPWQSNVPGSTVHWPEHFALQSTLHRTSAVALQLPLHDKYPFAAQAASS